MIVFTSKALTSIYRSSPAASWLGLLALALTSAVMLQMASPAGAFVAQGSLAQLPEPANCVGEILEEKAICGTKIGSGLNFAYQSAVSPDGKNVYSVAINGALVEYERNLANGALKVIGCLTAVKTPATPCSPENAVEGETVVDSLAALAITPNGENVYLLDQDKDMVVELSRNKETGLLSVMKGPKGNPECIAEGATGSCETTTGIGLGTPYGITVSPDEKNVYVASLGSEAVAEFSRNTTTGTLEQIAGHECIGSTTSGCPQHEAIGLNSAIGVVVAPGGEDVYVAAGAKNAESDVAAFSRNAEGALEQLPAEEGCIGGEKLGCTEDKLLNGSEDLVISPDGKNVYANSYGNDAVIELERETSGPKTGELKELTSPNECVSKQALSGCTEVATLLANPLGVAISQDGTNLYVDSSSEQTVSAFTRNAVTGALELLPTPYECVTTDFSGCGEAGTDSTGLIGLEGARRLTVSPDGTNVYVAGQSGNDLVELARRVKPSVSETGPTEAEGSEAGGTSVEIIGTGFAEGDKVVFHETEALTVTVNSATSITAVSPPGSGEHVNLNVIGLAGESANTAKSQFTWTKLQRPTIGGLGPSGGSEKGGTRVTITGSEFTTGDTVRFGETPASEVTYESPTKITVTSPAGSGKTDVRVTNAAGTSAIEPSDVYSYGLVGGLDLSGYCQSLGYAGGAEVSGTNPEEAYDWVCVNAGEKVPFATSGPAPSMDNACETQHPGSHAVIEDPKNANAWVCYENIPVTEEPPEGGGGTPTPTAKTSSVSPSITGPPSPTSPGTALGPVLAVTGNVAPVSGTVLVRLPGSSKFVPLLGLQLIPFGTVIDATHGKVTVTTVGPNGKLQSMTFFEGQFKLTQGRNGVVIAELTGGDFSVCPTVRERAHRAAFLAAHASPKHAVRKLWAEGHGSYTTKGNYAAGAVLGTRWLTEDLCDGTLIHVATDKVAVTDLVNHKKKTVKAGHSFLAKAP